MSNCASSNSGKCWVRCASRYGNTVAPRAPTARRRADHSSCSRHPSDSSVRVRTADKPKAAARCCSAGFVAGSMLRTRTPSAWSASKNASTSCAAARRTPSNSAGAVRYHSTRTGSSVALSFSKNSGVGRRAECAPSSSGRSACVAMTSKAIASMPMIHERVIASLRAASAG